MVKKKFKVNNVKKNSVSSPVNWSNRQNKSSANLNKEYYKKKNSSKVSKIGSLSNGNKKNMMSSSNLVIDYKAIQQSKSCYGRNEVNKFTSDEAVEFLHRGLLSEDEEEVPEKRKVETTHERISNLTPEQDNTIKKLYKDRRKMMSNRPFLFVKDVGGEASLNLEEMDRYPIFFPDIQEIISLVQKKIDTSRVFYVKKLAKLQNTIILIVHGVAYDEYESVKESCPTLNNCEAALEFVSPLGYGDSVEHCFASELKKKPKVKSKLRTGWQGFQRSRYRSGKDWFVGGLDTIFNIKSKVNGIDSDDGSETNDEPKRKKAKGCNSNFEIKPTPIISFYEKDKFSRLNLVMTPMEMANNKYPLPILKYCKFVTTKDEYSPVTEKSPMFGLDCEMCLTKSENELTRISIVNEKHQVVYERLVKPDNKIINYLTKYSGITPQMMKNVTTRLTDVQLELRELLPSDAILVGHSLDCDLIALKMIHPYVIDTSTIFNITGQRRLKTKLSTLCAEFLSEKIQCSSRLGHDSIEDSLAALKLVQAKLKQSVEWGDSVLGYSRTEQESRNAHLLMLEKCKNTPKVVRYRMAENAVVDNPSVFDPPSSEADCSGLDPPSEVVQQNLIDHQITDIVEDSEVKEEDTEKTSKICDKFNNSDVVIVGMKKVVKTYKKLLTKSDNDKTTFIKVDKNDDVLNQVLQIDSEEENRLIIAHVESSEMNEVEKWSKKFTDACKPQDLFCLLLVGDISTEIKRGAFFGSIPASRKIESLKTIINEHLIAWGHKTV